MEIILIMGQRTKQLTLPSRQKYKLKYTLLSYTALSHTMPKITPCFYLPVEVMLVRICEIFALCSVKHAFVRLAYLLG